MSQNLKNGQTIQTSNVKTARPLWVKGVYMYTKWNESGFRPSLCTYRLNWAKRTSWGWWDDWDDTVLQTQNSKFEPWRSEAEHATSRSRRLPIILTFTRGWGRNIFCFLQTAETGNRTPDSGVKGSGANHYPRAPALHVYVSIKKIYWFVTQSGHIIILLYRDTKSVNTVIVIIFLLLLCGTVNKNMPKFYGS